VDLAVGAVEPTAGGWRVEVGVPAGSRWFEGHFPGHPLLPAVAQLDLVERLLARLAGPGALVAVERLRLPAPVGPGDRLLVELARPGAAGRTAFSITRDGETTCDGTVAWSPATGDGAQPGEPGSAEAVTSGGWVGGPSGTAPLDTSLRGPAAEPEPHRRDVRRDRGLETLGLAGREERRLEVRQRGREVVGARVQGHGIVAEEEQARGLRGDVECVVELGLERAVLGHGRLVQGDECRVVRVLDDARIPARGAAGDRVTLDEHDGEPGVSEEGGRGRAEDAAADDDCVTRAPQTGHPPARLPAGCRECSRAIMSSAATSRSTSAAVV
jgi:3-hydroxyacyl-[acyl-carrier-protein] dehydratase